MKVIIGLVLYTLIISQLSLQFGIVQETWTQPETPESPAEDSGGGFFSQVADAIQAALAPFRWVFNTIAVVFMFMTFQIEEIPDLINTILITPVGAGVLWLGVRLVRGGG